MKLLERVKEKQILLADRMKKLRMKDALQLYEYEVTDAQSQYKVNPSLPLPLPPSHSLFPSPPPLVCF